MSSLDGTGRSWWPAKRMSSVRFLTTFIQLLSNKRPVLSPAVTPIMECAAFRTFPMRACPGPRFRVYLSFLSKSARLDSNQLDQFQSRSSKAPESVASMYATLWPSYLLGEPGTLAEHVQQACCRDSLPNSE